jgi:hypothetical protein
MARLQPYFPKSHGGQRVNDRRALSGIIFVNRNGLRWCDAPKEYGRASASDTSVWHLALLPSIEAYCGAPPDRMLPLLRQGCIIDQRNTSSAPTILSA